MASETGRLPARPNPTAAKAAYSRAARKKLTDSRARLDGVEATIKRAISTGRLQNSAQLDRTLEATEINFAAAETQLRQLQKSGESDWDRQRVELENAWEDLARSVKSLVAHFADRTA